MKGPCLMKNRNFGNEKLLENKTNLKDSMAALRKWVNSKIELKKLPRMVINSHHFLHELLKNG